ncbi:MAG: 4Fe-4S dicluster domain-containing protein [Clostridiales bacterium]|nr:4Fe-4S dicluster domain-containing protein [Clostridiales bacterium]
MLYLDFQKANCKNCYKCLRACPVKAIDAQGGQAKIIESRCILCGHCTQVCPRNAKSVHNDSDAILRLLQKSPKVIASVAPAFVASFGLSSFEPMRTALKAVGFYDAFETSEGAAAVTAEYKKLLATGKYDNFITSACPAVNRAIELYHHEALKYLAPVDSPMVAHAKILKKRYPDADIVFVGPCIAKKREAKESGVLSGALTFEELIAILAQKGVEIVDAPTTVAPKKSAKATAVKAADVAAEGEVAAVGETTLKAKYYPISRGIIKSFDEFPDGYEYIAVDGVSRLDQAIKDLLSVKHVFLEINACEGACVNGPCSIKRAGGSVEANVKVRNYVSSVPADVVPVYPDISKAFKPKKAGDREPAEDEIKAVLASTGKHCEADELNCGACGYSTCREKAWAVINGYAEVEMCVPYMREKAESMGSVIIENSPNGIIVCGDDLSISEINRKAQAMIGISSPEYIFDCFDPTAAFKAADSGKPVHVEKLKIDKTGKYVDMMIVPLEKEKALLVVLTDITEKVNYDEELSKVKRDTLAVTDTVIEKQMRVAQEIASLLGETTAETKVALLKLKAAMIDGGSD